MKKFLGFPGHDSKDGKNPLFKRNHNRSKVCCQDTCCKPVTIIIMIFIIMIIITIIPTGLLWSWGRWENRPQRRCKVKFLINVIFFLHRFKNTFISSKCQTLSSFSQERIELSENDDEEKRRREEIDWLGWFFLWWNELLIFQRQTRSIFYFCTFMPNLSIPGTFYNDNQRIEVINGKWSHATWQELKIVLKVYVLERKKEFLNLYINCLNSLYIVLACTVRPNPRHVSFWIIIRM